LQISTRLVVLEASALAQLAHAGEAKPGDYVVVDVADSGVGMSAETLRRIFEPFYTTKFAGRGLGLSAVLGIVRSHSGALDVSSTPGRGTRFVAYFPASTLPMPDRAADATARGAANMRPALPNRRSVLVVDDEVDVLELAAVSLRKHGFVVHTAENGAQAVAMFERQPGAFDGVLLDLTMPQMDGLRTLERLRALRPNVKAALMSGYDPTEANQRAPGAKPDLFLPKPFSVTEVVDCVQRLLK
jgi:two-component system, cell cycle sensor histidine kinase and response regulator CckA